MKTSCHRMMKFNSTQKYREINDVYPSISQKFQCQSIYMFSILYDTQKNHNVYFGGVVVVIVWKLDL